MGAEPLGLLRWNDVTFETLSAALEARFARMGEPETTELVAGSIGELYVRDRRWDLGMHTFLFTREVSQDTLFPKMCRRVAYLRDKFVADLEAAEKVLVYKDAGSRLRGSVAPPRASAWLWSDPAAPRAAGEFGRLRLLAGGRGRGTVGTGRAGPLASDTSRVSAISTPSRSTKWIAICRAAIADDPHEQLMVSARGRHQSPELFRAKITVFVAAEHEHCQQSRHSDAEADREESRLGQPYDDVGGSLPPSLLSHAG